MIALAGICLLISCARPMASIADNIDPAQSSDQSARKFSFSYAVTVFPTSKALDIFLPVAQSNAEQKILDLQINSPITGEMGIERTYGNKFWHAALPDGLADTTSITFTYLVDRPANTLAYRKKVPQVQLTSREEELFLKANNHVPVNGALVDSINQDLRPAPPQSLEQARAIYDYVVDNMEYKKIGTGWGNGDTYWACSEKYGNCTDFHALFTSLARSDQIPSRFEIGFPVPSDRDQGTISGYHCWVNFYLPETGWFPIDASEASKNPSQKDLFFGTQPADRIQFTIGRDLELGEGQRSGPLNYFIYPHLEQNGQLYSGFTRNFSYHKIG